MVGADNVAEENGGEHPVGLWLISRLRRILEELSYFFEDWLRVAGDDHLVDTWELNVACTGDVVGQVAGALNVDRIFPGAVQHERRRGDRRQDVPHVDLVGHTEEGLDVAWARTLPLGRGQRELRLRVGVKSGILPCESLEA